MRNVSQFWCTFSWLLRDSFQREICIVTFFSKLDLPQLKKHILRSNIHLYSILNKEKVPSVLSDYCLVKHIEVVKNWMPVKCFVAEELIVKNFVNFILVDLLKVLAKMLFKKLWADQWSNLIINEWIIFQSCYSLNGRFCNSFELEWRHMNLQMLLKVHWSKTCIEKSFD